MCGLRWRRVLGPMKVVRFWAQAEVMFTVKAETDEEAFELAEEAYANFAADDYAERIESVIPGTSLWMVYGIEGSDLQVADIEEVANEE